MVKTILLTLTVLMYAGQSVAAQTITQGYDADTILQRGMLVALKNDDVRKVEPINNNRQSEVHGVVVAGNDAAISISGENQKVFVASSGKFEVLVTDLNGVINEGDYIAVSPLSGIGMKSDENQSVVIGKSLKVFRGQNSDNFVSSVEVTDDSGNSRRVNLGRVEVDIVIGKNPFVKGSDAPLVLQRIGESIAGEPVSASRIFFALGLLVTATGTSGAIIYAAVRHGIVSIGRNPLSKKLIRRSMFQMIIIAFIIFFSALFGVYLVLKL